MNTKPKILIVDDKPENLVAIEVVLRELDVELVKVTSGNAALIATLHHDFALALLDIQMPEMDGYELASILRDEEKTSNLPFIFISAVYTDNLNVFNGYEKGAFSFITKPFKPEMLISKVNFFIKKYQQEIELKMLNRSLISANKELEQFAYVASHDLQEPLRTISNFVGLLNERYFNCLDANAKDYLCFIMGATTRMQHLIKDLLTFSRIGKDQPFAKIDCNLVLKNVLADLFVTLKEKHARITYPELPVLVGTEIEFKQLFQNLICNAIKFCKKEVIPEVTISVKENNQEYLFAFTDNGIGIEEQYINHIFIIFKRLHSMSEYEGTGIGLATCKKIVSRHNGSIWVESKPGEGSTFYFAIPKLSYSLPC
jgi:two-component system sensor histidine kinase/response regulator